MGREAEGGRVGWMDGGRLHFRRAELEIARACSERRGERGVRLGASVMPLAAESRTRKRWLSVGSFVGLDLVAVGPVSCRETRGQTGRMNRFRDPDLHSLAFNDGASREMNARQRLSCAHVLVRNSSGQMRTMEMQ